MSLELIIGLTFGIVIGISIILWIYREVIICDTVSTNNTITSFSNHETTQIDDQ